MTQRKARASKWKCSIQSCTILNRKEEDQLSWFRYVKKISIVRISHYSDSDEEYILNFRFPKDTQVRNLWLSIVRVSQERDDWLPTSSSRLCSRHFSSEDFKHHETDIRLCHGTVPNRNIPDIPSASLEIVNLPINTEPVIVQDLEPELELLSTLKIQNIGNHLFLVSFL
jgi:hypothetical protein